MVNMNKVDDGFFNFLNSCPAAPAGFQVASDFCGPAEWELPVFQKKKFLIGHVNLLSLHSVTFYLRVRGGPGIGSKIWTRRPETCPVLRRFHDSGGLPLAIEGNAGRVREVREALHAGASLSHSLTVALQRWALD